MGPLRLFLDKLVAVDLAKWSAKKTFYYGLLVTVFPIVLYNTLLTLNFAIMAWALNKISASGLTSTTVEITSLGAWMAQKLRIVEIFNLFIVAVTTRFTIGMMKGW